MTRPDEASPTRAPVGAPWGRVLAGVLCLLMGSVWIAQGTGHLSGSFMTGETQWTVIGALVVVAGIALLAWAARAAKRNQRTR